ncbi:versican core protein-like [Macrosteles quadrilineatus]|uniref:versican core protein-like n=1 Tax=Macrosteles quadrilineatus TaxID=74068 RepID=UPI0023E1C98F|nr:versican core protein-like [Macrosteles quadrilineatus]
MEQAYIWLCVLVCIGSATAQPLNNSTGNCTYDNDCSPGLICVDSQCVDPCNVCGLNTECVVDEDDTPLCYCKPGHQGDPFTECTAGECTKNSDCSSDRMCLSNRCEDPCQDGCGLNTACRVVNHRPLCACLPGFVFTMDEGCTTSSMPECQSNSHCPDDRSCRLQKCVDPCEDRVCGNNTDCYVKNHYPVCSCQVGFIGDAYNGCVPYCPSGGSSKTGNKTYHFSNTTKSWFDALDDCYSQGMKLATVNNEDEWTSLIAAYNSTITGNSFWLGGNDLERYKEFRWVTDGNFLNFTNWRSGEPNGTPYHCLQVLTDLTWQSITCTNTYYYVCQSTETPTSTHTI